MKAIVLLSGGLDSSTALYYARSRGFKCFCLCFDYGQRHKREVFSARRIAESSGSECRILKIGLPWQGSSLLDRAVKLPAGRIGRKGVPSTYVPGRNIIFLSYAASYAESVGALNIFIGANQIDYSGYPDCRAVFLRAFNTALSKGLKRCPGRKGISVKAPLINKTKKDIIGMAFRLGVPVELTWSCYKGGSAPCGRCDSCLIRAAGFKETGYEDPII